MAIRDLIVRISAQSSDFERGIANAQKGLLAFSNKVGEIGNSLSLNITAPLAALAGFGLKAAAEFDSLKRGLTAVSGSSKAAEEQLVRLKKVAELPGLGFQEAIRGSVNLQAAGISANTAERALVAFGNALATVGKGRAELDGVITALSQIQSKGKVSAEEINQLAERLPQIRVVMKEVFGTADTEVIQKLGISTDEFIKKIITGFEKLPQATGGVANAFENLRDRAQEALTRIGETLVPAATKFISTAEPMLKKIADLAAGFTKLPEPIQNTTIAILALAATSGPLLKVVASLAALKVSLLAIAANPISLFILALGGAFFAASHNVDVLKESFKAFEQRMARLKNPELDLTDFKKETKDAADAVAQIPGAFAKQLKLEVPEGVNSATDAMRALGITGGATSDTVSRALNATAERAKALGIDLKATFTGLQLPAGFQAATDGSAKATASLTTQVGALGKATEQLKKPAVSLVETFLKLDQTLRDQQGVRDAAADFLKAEASMLAFLNAIERGTEFSLMIEQSDSLAASIASLSAGLPIAGAGFEDLALSMQNSINRSSEVLEFLEREQALIDRALAPARTQGPVSTVFNPDGNKALQEAIRNQEALNDASQRGEEQFKRTGKAVTSAFSRQVSTVVTDLSRGLVDVIAKAKTMGEVFNGVLQQIAQSFLRYLIEGSINLAIKQLGKLTGGLGGLASKISSLFGKAAGGGGGEEGGEGGLGGGGDSSGLSGLLGSVSAMTTAIFAGLSFFQGRRVEKDTGNLEVTSRSTLNVLTSMHETMRQTLLSLPEIKGYLFNTQLQAFNNISSALEAIAGSGGIRTGSGTSSVVINVYGATNGNIRELLNEAVRELRLVDPRFA